VLSVQSDPSVIAMKSNAVALSGSREE